MSKRTTRVATLVAEIGFRDPARPVEWLSLILLSGWAQFLLGSPQVFAEPRYAAFSALPPLGWALITLGVVTAQLVAMGPVRSAPKIRFYAMALATGLWVVIAFTFWSSNLPLLARTHSAIALVTAMTGLYLGWTSQRS